MNDCAVRYMFHGLEAFKVGKYIILLMKLSENFLSKFCLKSEKAGTLWE